jgi:hypothetical protein
MKKFAAIKARYLQSGAREENIDYAIAAVKEGTKREHIIESLCADYRGMTAADATGLLDDLYLANGGEFKKENRGGYLFGALLLMLGLAASGFLIMMFTSGSEIRIKFVMLAIAGAGFGLVKGSTLLFKSFSGRYRENDDPFAESFS